MGGIGTGADADVETTIHGMGKEGVQNAMRRFNKLPRFYDLKPMWTGKQWGMFWVFMPLFTLGLMEFTTQYLDKSWMKDYEVTKEAYDEQQSRIAQRKKKWLDTNSSEKASKN